MRKSQAIRREVSPASGVAPKGAGRRRTSRSRGEEVSQGVLQKAQQVAQETGHVLLTEVCKGPTPPELQPLNNALMDAYREHRSVDAFSLLFELNSRPLSAIAAYRMRQSGCRADIHDVLQETFLAIYRYPTRFCPDKPNAFRNWSYSILRNTIYRQGRARMKNGIPVEVIEDTLVDEMAESPYGATEDAESLTRCHRIYGVFLAVYVEVYAQDLTPRDQLALDLVEVRHLPYREAASIVGVRLENFKMIVCRARKKILQGMMRTLGSQPS